MQNERYFRGVRTMISTDMRFSLDIPFSMIGRYCLILTIYISCEPGPNRPSCVQRIDGLAVRREITRASRVYAEITEFARFFFSCGSLPRSAQNSLPREIPWRELTGIWPPSFARRARCKATGHAPGGRDRQASFELRCGGWFHRSEVPFGEGTGLFGRQVSVEINAASRRPRLSSLPIGREFNPYAKSLIISRMRDGGSRHVAPLRRWLR